MSATVPVHDWQVVAIVALLVLAAVFLSRRNGSRLKGVRIGFFFERDHLPDDHSDEHPSEGDTKIMGPWPGQKKEEE